MYFSIIARPVSQIGSDKRLRHVCSLPWAIADCLLTEQSTDVIAKAFHDLQVPPEQFQNTSAVLNFYTSSGSRERAGVYAANSCYHCVRQDTGTVDHAYRVCLAKSINEPVLFAIFTFPVGFFCNFALSPNEKELESMFLTVQPIMPPGFQRLD